MKKINPNEAGLALGVLMGLWHAVWSVLVAIGMAKPFLDFIFGLHMIVNPYKLMAFSITSAIMLVAVTFVIGYVMGFVFAVIWNSGRKG